MEKKARITNEEIEKMKLFKQGYRKNINETLKKKTQAEIDLKTKQCEALKLKLSLLDDCHNLASVEECAKNLDSIEVLIKKKEGIVKGLERKLEALEKEEADLSEDVKDAKRSYSGMVEVLSALKSK